MKCFSATIVPFQRPIFGSMVFPTGSFISNETPHSPETPITQIRQLPSAAHPRRATGWDRALACGFAGGSLLMCGNRRADALRCRVFTLRRATPTLVKFLHGCSRRSSIHVYRSNRGISRHRGVLCHHTKGEWRSIRLSCRVTALLHRRCTKQLRRPSRE